MGQLQEIQHSHHRGARRRRESSGNCKSIKEIIKGNFPSEGDRHAIPGSTESQSNWTQRGPHQDISYLKCCGLKIKKESYKQQERSRVLPTKEIP